MDNLYPDSPPEMRPSFVCYADILGYKKLSKQAIESGEGVLFLHKLHKALSSDYKYVKSQEYNFTGDSRFRIKVFTDNLVIGYPVFDLPIGQSRNTLFHILDIFAQFQIGLIMEEFFIRGGIAFGDHYMDDFIVFGNAFIEAYEQDMQGAPPYISFTSSALAYIRQILSKMSKLFLFQYEDKFLKDVNGTIFLNYLEVIFNKNHGRDMIFYVMKNHQEAIINCLKKNKDSPDVRIKYEWVAGYHNYICKKYAEKYPPPDNNESNEILFSGDYDDQNLLDYIIDIESFAGTPSTISLIPMDLS